jgi:uncharacterized protein YxeA
MKVYLVWREYYTSYSYDGTREELVCVFSTREKADEYLKVTKSETRLSIEEWKVSE